MSQRATAALAHELGLPTGSTDCLVIMPVGPRSLPEFVRDTIESFRHHMPEDEAHLLVLDDTRQSNWNTEEMPSYPNVHWLAASEPVLLEEEEHNTRGVLLLKQLRALELISTTLQWRCLMRLDDDALFIGPSPHRDALACFAEHPDVGMLGAYLRRGDGSDKRHALARQSSRLMRQLASVRNPRMVAHLLDLVARGKRKGFSMGHMCTGGALFLSREAYEGTMKLWRRGGTSLANPILADDLLLSLYTAAAGFRLLDFSDADQVMAVNWRGLPMPLDELVRRGKKVVHPVKVPGEPEQEREIRAFFRERRIESTALSGAPSVDAIARRHARTAHRPVPSRDAAAHSHRKSTRQSSS